MSSFIIFDFDGVLVDSFGAALETVREHQPDREISADEYRACFEGNAYEVADEKNFCFVFREFFDRYLPRLLECKPAEGIEEAIRSVAAAHTLAIISSTDSRVLREWLEKNGLLSYFTDLLGADISKSKVEKFSMLFKKYGIEGKNCIFVTDTLGDLREAEAVGVPCIAVTYGWHSEDRLRKGKFIAMVNRPSEIIEVIEKMK
jgi:phosphoglycolate phosphatase